jgi:hypothetical protein
VKCAAHPTTRAIGACTVCKTAVCPTCATYDLDGSVCCETCGVIEEERSRSIGAALLAFVGVGYLASLALCVAIFHARPFIGGIAAIVAIALGRVLQIVLKPRVVTRRLRRTWAREEFPPISSRRSSAADHRRP